MKIISILSQKGGASKTTVAIHLAVEAQKEGFSTAIIDLDPQASASKWGDIRKENSPAVISAQYSRLHIFLEDAKKAGAELVIIDTAPHSDGIATTSAKSADLVLIPTKCSILDLQTVLTTVELSQSAKKDPVIILSSVPVKGMTEIHAKEALESLGVEICPISLGDRAAFRNALSMGQSASEYDSKGKASLETKALWQWVKSKINL